MIPDIKNYNPDPDYLKSLIVKAGISQREAARRLGINERLFRMYIADRTSKSSQACTYPVQFCIEALARRNEKL